jgi:carbon-monoxide dehydrogenase medium subunit
MKTNRFERRAIMKPFEYLEPRTVGEATQLLSNYGKKARILAGGIDLIPKMRKDLINAEYIVNIQRIPGLDYVKPQGKQGLRFGAMTRLYSVETSEVIQRHYPILYDAVHQITSVQAKCMGTAVGNLCVATPASDLATALMALGAELRIVGVKGKRTEPIEEFYLNYHRTSLKRGEMVTEVFLPNPAAGMKSAFLNLVRTHADIAKVSVAVAILVQDGICREAKIVIGAVAPTVFRAAKAEALLKGQKINHPIIHKVAEAAAGETRPITDLRSTAEYRKEMANVLVRRALEKALGEARI